MSYGRVSTPVSLIVVLLLLNACHNFDSISTPDSKTFVSQKFGYTFDYPDSWFVHENATGQVIITSFELGTLPGGEGIPFDETKIDIYPRNTDPDNSYISWLIRQMISSGIPISPYQFFVFPTGTLAVYACYETDFENPVGCGGFFNIAKQNFSYAVFGDQEPGITLIATIHTFSDDRN
ncbi:MAG TPA: hypothetical protein VHL11_09370 [Phototrophicaceae bacterium]|jgi:hypothetical protein|nr:hypothetical protein [Phototrophicaceae bacterium]